MAVKIATTKLFVGTALAHNPGDEVPAENVAANGWEDSVVGPNTKAADEARESQSEQGLATGLSEQI